MIFLGMHAYKAKAAHAQAMQSFLGSLFIHLWNETIMNRFWGWLDTRKVKAGTHDTGCIRVIAESVNIIIL